MRVLELSSSGNCGVDLLVGAMATTDEALATIRQLSDHIASVLLANHDGNSLPRRPVPLDQGRLDVVAVLGLLREMGFSGPVRATPGPKMVGDTQWGHKAHAHDLGFVRAVLQSLGATSGR